MEKFSVIVSVDVYINVNIECSDQTIICTISSKFSNFLCFIYYFVQLDAVIIIMSMTGTGFFCK